MFHQYILIYNSYKGYNKHQRLKLLHWEHYSTKPQIVLEGKEAVLISSLFKLLVLMHLCYRDKAELSWAFPGR